MTISHILGNTIGLNMKPNNRGVKVGATFAPHPLRNETLERINIQRIQIGLEPLIEKDRNCLNCDKQFTARGNGNFMCDNCRTKRSFL